MAIENLPLGFLKITLRPDMVLLTWCSLHGLLGFRPVSHALCCPHLHPKLVSDSIFQICLPCEFGIPPTINVYKVFPTGGHLQVVANALVVSKIVALPRDADAIVVRLEIQLAYSAHDCVCVCVERVGKRRRRRGEEGGRGGGEGGGGGGRKGEGGGKRGGKRGGGRGGKEGGRGLQVRVVHKRHS